MSKLMKIAAPALIGIDVCIATFKRPTLLEDLLHSLIAQDLTGLRLRIIVIDNDREQSARRAVTKFGDICPFEVVYDVEPQQNIALARNRALSHVTSDYCAFIDDDEAASPLWLRSLLDCLNRYDADIVFGPVISALPDDAPAWAKSCFSRTRRHTGELLQVGGTNNALLRRSVLADPSARFNPAFGLTGGEDTDFFYRQFLQGHRLIWCDQAIVTEPVADSRLTLQWIRRRGFRGGQTYYRIFVSRYSSIRKVAWFGIKALQLIGGALAAPILRATSYPSYVALTVRMAGASGQLSRCFAREDFEEYNVRHYQ
ncbi:MAG: glycosyltransferase family 2 protein [Pseudomonadota bacterium]